MSIRSPNHDPDPARILLAGKNLVDFLFRQRVGFGRDIPPFHHQTNLSQC
jgi:hypothetical protein